MTDYIPRSFARFLQDVVLLDSSGAPYVFGFEYGTLKGEDCECCNDKPAYYEAADDTLWCIMCWRNRQAFGRVAAHRRRKHSEEAANEGCPGCHSHTARCAYPDICCASCPALDSYCDKERARAREGTQ